MSLGGECAAFINLGVGFLCSDVFMGFCGDKMTFVLNWRPSKPFVSKVLTKK